MSGPATSKHTKLEVRDRLIEMLLRFVDISEHRPFTGAEHDSAALVLAFAHWRDMVRKEHKR